MIQRRVAATFLLFALLVPYTVYAQQPFPQPSPQPVSNPNDPIAKIRDEGLHRSQAMQTLSYLSDVIGPRLTASPNTKRANEWTRDTLAKWGLQNAHLEAWGPFGRPARMGRSRLKSFTSTPKTKRTWRASKAD
jgi:hypothetical protein